MLAVDMTVNMAVCVLLCNRLVDWLCIQFLQPNSGHVLELGGGPVAQLSLAYAIVPAFGDKGRKMGGSGVPRCAPCK